MSPAPGKHPAAAAGDLAQRLAVIETALRIQTATGASHLQQLENSPSTFGISADTRTAVKRLRRQRNKALHCHDQPFPAASRGLSSNRARGGPTGAAPGGDALRPGASLHGQAGQAVCA